MKERIRKFKLLSKEFGFFFAVKYYYLRETKRYDKYIDLIYSKLLMIINPVIEKYKNSESCTNSDNNNILWVCWWQGYDAMPELCKMCYSRLRSVVDSKYDIVLITKDNYQDYVEIPLNIIKRMELGSIGLTQFCDVLRQGLLFYNGGLWIDASVWVNKGFLETVEENLDFWSVKLDSIYDNSIWGQLISECKWSSFLLYGKKGNMVNGFIYESMCCYYNQYPVALDYFLQNLIIRLGYDKITAIHKIIDRIKPSNSHLYNLYELMNSAYDSVIWNRITADTCFFKLTQKRDYNELENGEKTFYGHLKQLLKYGEENEE